MHVFISDLHMTDTGTGGAVCDAQLEAFARRIDQMATERGKQIKLVLLGDIFDLLRSPLWAALWEEKKSAPWSAVSKNFKHFKNSPAEKTAIEIAGRISARYKTFLAALAKLVTEGKVETVYIPGNHDFMVQHSQGLRDIMKAALSLPQPDVSKPFRLTYSDEAAEVYATHGNSYDPVNYHRAVEGHWAMGDAVVLRIVNRFPDEVCHELHCSLDQEIGQLLQEIDNIEPLSDVPLYVRWLIDQNLVGQNSKAKVLNAWERVVDEFLNLEEFNEQPYKGSAFQMVRRAFKLSTKMRLAELIAELAKKFPGAGTDYRRAAKDELRKNPDYRFLVLGHTHKPTLEPLTSAPKDQAAFYVNTGCWRRLVTRPGGKDPRIFAARRVASYFVIDDSAGTASQERFHLFQEWHAN